MVLRTSTLWTIKGSPLRLPASRKNQAAFFRPPPVSSRDFFAGDFNPHAEVAVGLEVIDDFVGEVMDVDNHFADAKGAQADKGDFKQRAAGDE